VLAVATKRPYPPVGGGNVTLHGLLAGLQRIGVQVRVVALGGSAGSASPPYPMRTTHEGPRLWPQAAVSVLAGSPASLARYRVSSVMAAVEGELAGFAPHVVHLEQLHMAWLLPRLVGRVPVVLRQQNVESRLLERLAAVSGPHLRWLLRLEARRLRRVERRACELADVVAAISEIDGRGFQELAPASRVRVLPAAWEGEGELERERLTGEPAFVCIGSFDWRPNRDGVRWLLGEVWPIIRARAPSAVLHVAGPGSETLAEPACGGVVRRGRVPRAGALYDRSSVALVPLRVGSGVRLRLLEAWAAEVPAVTTPVGGEGLVARDGEGAILATAAPAFADAALSLAADSSLRRELIAAGSAKVGLHAVDRVAAQARQLYLEARSHAGAAA